MRSRAGGEMGWGSEERYWPKRVIGVELGTTVGLAPIPSVGIGTGSPPIFGTRKSLNATVSVAALSIATPSFRISTTSRDVVGTASFQVYVRPETSAGM